MSPTQQILEWAERGWSQEDCAQAMDLSYNKFRDFLRTQNGFTWPKSQTIGQRNCIRDRTTPAYLEAVGKMREAKLAKAERYTVHGVTGTRKELSAQFAVVSDITVWRRLQRGWSIEQALFTPNQQTKQQRDGKPFHFGRG